MAPSGLPSMGQRCFSIPSAEWRCLECAGWDVQPHPGHPSPPERPLEFQISPQETHYPINTGAAPGHRECHREGDDPKGASQVIPSRLDLIQGAN